MKEITIDIVLPIYNPHFEWEIDLMTNYNQLVDSLPSYISTRLILANDASTNNIGPSLDKIQMQYSNTIVLSHTINKGKGQALRSGMIGSDADYILYTDYDFPYSVTSMIKMINEVVEHDHPIVIPKRNNTYYQNISKSRRLLSKFLQSVNKLLLRIPIADTQGGFKMFHKDLKSIFLKTTINRYLIDVDFLKKVHREGYTIHPVEVELRSDIVLTKVSNMKIKNELLDYLKLIFS